MELISVDLISKATSIKTKSDLFNKIGDLLFAAKKIDSKEQIVADLKAREKLGSTAFDNGLMMPHAISKEVKEPCIVVVEFPKVDFQAIDNKKTDLAVAIMIPKSSKKLHLKVLSKLSNLFSSKERLDVFRKKTDAQKVEVINKIAKEVSIKNASSEILKPSSDHYDFVAITSCAAGIAHTYMARDALVDAAKRLGLKAKVETRGAMTENKLSKTDIANAKLVIVAADVEISLTPFDGKKVLQASTNDAIRNAEKLIKEAPQAPIFKKTVVAKEISILSGDDDQEKSKELGQSIWYALSFIVPITIVCFLLVAIPNHFASTFQDSITDPDGKKIFFANLKFTNEFVGALWNFGHWGLILTVPIFAMFLAYKIGGKPAMPAALIGAYFINWSAYIYKFSWLKDISDINPAIPGVSAGFFGALAVGVIVGYGVKWMQWINWHKAIAPIANLMLVPILSSFIMFLIITYFLGPIATYLVIELTWLLSHLSSLSMVWSLMIGIALVVLIAINLGERTNILAILFALIVITTTVSQTAGVAGIDQSADFEQISALIIALPALVVWTVTMLLPKHFSAMHRNVSETILDLENHEGNSKLGKAIMSGLSFMIPVTITGGILMSIPNALAAGGNKKGGTWHFPNSFAEGLWNFGHLGLLLMIPILAMFLAYKIAGKAAIPAALIGAYFINDGVIMGKYSLFALPSSDGLSGSASAGFLGGLAVGIIVGYIVRYMQKLKVKKSLQPCSNLIAIPLLSSFLTFLVVVYVIGSPMTWIMAEMYHGLKTISSINIWVNMLIGMLFAVLMAIDLGGPLNKTTLVVATAIFASTIQLGPDKANFIPQTAVQSAISIPPLGMWLATLLFPKKFSKTERTAGQAALPMGAFGITEGALPFAFKTPLKAMAANMSGAAVTGALVSLFEIKFYGGLGSPLGAYIGYSQHNFYGLTWILSIVIGVVITAVIFGLLTSKNNEYADAYNKHITKKIENFNAKGITTRFGRLKYNFKKTFSNTPSKLKFIVNPLNWIKKPVDWDE